MPRTASRIPVGTQFSPDLLSLPDLVAALVLYGGNRDALEAALTSPPARIRPYAKPPTRRMRGLPVEAAIQYGLLEEGTLQATDLTHALAALSGLPLYEAFARHILLNLHGLRVVEGAQEMVLDGRSVTGDSLARYLTEQGFPVTEHNTAINTMRMWLARAGLYPLSGRGEGAWRADPVVKERLVGLSDDSIGALAGFTPPQVAFALSLARRGPTTGEELLAADVRDLAETSYGVRVGRGSLPNEVLRPLQDAGLITYRTGGTAGGKSARLSITPTFDAEVLVPFLERTIHDLDADLTRYFQTRPADISHDLMGPDRYAAGRALEAFVVFLMRLLGLRFVGWRRRAQETGFGEVDVLMAGLIGALPTTWQIQCKNTPSQQVRHEDIAREVGLLHLTRATHILVVANARYTEDARKFAEETMLFSPVTIFLLDQTDFQMVLQRPEALGRILSLQGERIRARKLAAPLWSGVRRPGQG